MPLGAKLLSDKSACAEWKFGGAAGLGWCWTLDKAFERQSGPRSGPPGGDLSPDLPTLVAGSRVAGGNQERWNQQNLVIEWMWGMEEKKSRTTCKFLGLSSWVDNGHENIKQL